MKSFCMHVWKWHTLFSFWAVESSDGHTSLERFVVSALHWTGSVASAGSLTLWSIGLGPITIGIIVAVVILLLCKLANYIFARSHSNKKALIAAQQVQRFSHKPGLPQCLGGLLTAVLISFIFLASMYTTYVALAVHLEQDKTSEWGWAVVWCEIAGLVVVEPVCLVLDLVIHKYNRLRGWRLCSRATLGGIS